MNECVTLAIPVYNVERYVEKALLSALNQTYTNIEFIVVDDRGTDNSMAIVRSILAVHSRKNQVKIIEHTENKGLGAARNTALDNTQGRYIFFMDSDDELTADCISILCQKMEETPVDFVVASVAVKDRNEQLLRTNIRENIIYRDMDIIHAYYCAKKRHTPVWNKLYDVDFLKKNNIRAFPNHLNEDVLFTFQVVQRATSCRYISDITYNYYETPTSITSNVKRKIVMEREAKQYVECVNFEKEYIRSYPLVVREIVARFIIFQTLYFAQHVKQSKVLDKTKKRYYLTILLSFPFSINEIKKFQHKLFFYGMYMIFKLPFTLSWYKLIKNFVEFGKK